MTAEKGKNVRNKRNKLMDLMHAIIARLFWEKPFRFVLCIPTTLIASSIIIFSCFEPA